MTGGSGSNVDSISSLDVGNLLHLQTNDNNSGPLINLKLTGSENYRVWSNAMKIALQARNKMCFVDGTCTKVAYATSVPLSNQWERCNAVVLSWLLSSISDDLYLSQVYSENAAEFLMGLDDVYFPIRSSLLTQTELPDVKDTFVIVCRKESHRGLGSGTGVQKPTKNSSSMPFTSDQIAKLMSLIGDKPGNGIHANMAGANQHIASSTNNMINVIDISKLNITVGHPNGTTAKIKKDLKRENILGTGSEAGGLYVFNTEFIKPFFDDFQTDSQASSPNDDGGEPSGSNIGSESESDDTAREQSSDYDQGSMQIGEEDFYEENVFENYDVPTNLFKTEESNTREKMEALYEINSWDLVELPKNMKAIGSKWAYKIKHKPTGEIDRYKARLVANGFNQREGIDYEETFSPVVKMGTVKCLISLTIQNGWCLFQLDVNNAFLYDNLNEDVYMLPQPGYFNKNETRVCKLKRSLYGLKQALRQWNNRFSEELVKNDFKQSGHDHSLYTKESGGSFVALLVYVDDIVLTRNDINEINKVKTFLKSKFKIKDLGEFEYFLGIEPVSTPLLENIILAHKESEDDNQHMQSPLQSHMDLGLRVLSYLKGAPGSSVNYEKSDHMSLKVYADSDWAKCPVTRRPVLGYCVFFNGCMVSWKSKKQATLSKSYAEAEYKPMATATCEVIWVVNILKDLKVINLRLAELFCDNSAAIQIDANLVMDEKTKHFDLDVHIIREKVASGLIKTTKIASENQTADIFTKALGFPQHSFLVKKLTLLNMYTKSV
ncbi:putative RNA-directed DNA polymerase [Tanacetum coccineum]|uniref:RNA-directed DNA polymerase n=1 Tax=Tanacetum coccineum TaxID=301880 RepID=A0ABQ5E083_9ASTR